MDLAMTTQATQAMDLARALAQDLNSGKVDEGVLLVAILELIVTCDSYELFEELGRKRPQIRQKIAAAIRKTWTGRPATADQQLQYTTKIGAVQSVAQDVTLRRNGNRVGTGDLVCAVATVCVSPVNEILRTHWPAELEDDGYAFTILREIHAEHALTDPHEANMENDLVTQWYDTQWSLVATAGAQRTQEVNTDGDDETTI
jgi:hypothetical protein